MSLLPHHHPPTPSRRPQLEPICETRYEGDLEAAGAYLEPTTP